MDHNHLSYTIQPSTPSPPSASLGLQSTYHLPQAVHLAYTGYHGAYNTDWGPEQQQVFLVNATQNMGGDPSTAGVAPITSNVGYTCMWVTSDVLCAQGFAKFDDLMIHLARVHDMQGAADRKLVCRWLTNNNVCCSKERVRNGLRRHIRTHVGHKVPCTECGKPYSREDSMRAHWKKEHGKK
ncbi:hypothetical protein OG21DRAFT_1504796 [Imleria badia]|nr:hypothetical protein OG21DRAFT_1504796 [Imleria badia]